MSGQVILMNGVPGAFVGFADGCFKPASSSSPEDKARRDPSAVADNFLNRAIFAEQLGDMNIADRLFGEALAIERRFGRNSHDHDHRV